MMPENNESMLMMMMHFDDGNPIGGVLRCSKTHHTRQQCVLTLFLKSVTLVFVCFEICHPCLKNRLQLIHIIYIKQRIYVKNNVYTFKTTYIPSKQGSLTLKTRYIPCF